MTSHSHGVTVTSVECRSHVSQQLVVSWGLFFEIFISGVEVCQCFSLFAHCELSVSHDLGPSLNDKRSRNETKNKNVIPKLFSNSNSPDPPFHGPFTLAPPLFLNPTPPPFRPLLAVSCFMLHLRGPLTSFFFRVPSQTKNKQIFVLAAARVSTSTFSTPTHESREFLREKCRCCNISRSISAFSVQSLHFSRFFSVLSWNTSKYSDFCS